MAIKYFGSGTQRVEQEIKKLFGEVRVARMDRDTTKTTGSHERLYKSFAQNDVDILIGTQMITKGWDLPNVRLIGIVSADAMLNYPDYRANEHAYQLITQIAGRTGRGEHIGKVILQTYLPDNPIFKAIQAHDYTLFYKSELTARQELGYPPFAKLVKLLYNDESFEHAKSEAERVSGLLAGENMIGPSPAFIPKLSGKYRFQVTVKTNPKNDAEFTRLVQKITQITANNWSIDVDPASLL
jgi:primosomal protein N' (replication factor Y)